ncbi:MAG TPA: Eco57I restriction-modification methylase domain-containing protein [Ktedonobacteraceae bacterium]|nr:Eco57I restriction-modification methylase domain-containing protein [Ktedonobacteraceae bacterium]
MNSNSPMSGNADKVTQLAFVPHPHRNQQLFSDHYLNVILPRRKDWQMLVAEAELVMRDLQRILAGYTPGGKEAQVEDDFVKPVLRQLGHTFEVQPSLETPDGTKTPDYIFYRDQAALVANKGKKKLNETLLQGRAFAVGDAKQWDRLLDVSLKSVGNDRFTNKNPSYQISFYMQHSGLDWGILSNGQLWRLYHKDTAHKLDRFYEVNLTELLDTGNINNFLYFYAFFRRQAFDPGDLSIEAIRLASADYARGVGDSLKIQVYEALRHVAQGFLDYRPNKLNPEPDMLKAIYDNALIILYRLLFIFYAESRDLLPVHENALYREDYSLESMKKGVQKNLDARKYLLPNTAILWPKVKALFTLINEGSPPLNIATFNGGLFDPERYPFLERYAVGDQRLQQAIDKLARVDRQFVDYRDLAERHLGTIYEGLLEFHLEKAAPSDHGWTIDLKTEKGERKATGSYYTPDYIVKYIVEETLGPVLYKAVANATTEQEKITAVLNVKVLDPAMGSGHFPVEATEYIARFLVENIEQPPTDTGGEADLAYWKRRVVQSCIYGVDLNPLAVDLAKLSLWLVTVAKNRPFSFLDHHLRCGNSLIGERLADLQIGTVGAQKKRNKKAQPVQEATVTQSMLFDEESLRQAVTTAVDMMWLIESSPAQTVAEVKEQEQIYGNLRQRLIDKYSMLAHLVSATYFGLAIDSALWKPLADYATGRGGIMLAQFDTWLQAATDLSGEHLFFHWELEFSEVFFDRYGRHKGTAAGFDVVIGNPPYVRQEELGPLKTYFAAAYPETYHGVADLYVYFYQRGLQLSRAGGRMSYIVTNKWMRSGYGEPLRAFFAKEGVLKRIIDFGHAPIFEDADVFPCILVLEKPMPQMEQDQQSERQVQVLNFPRGELDRMIQNKGSLGRYISEHSHDLPCSRFDSTAWNLESSTVDDLMAKFRRIGVPLAEFAGLKTYRGVLTGRNEAFLIDTPTKNRLVRDDPRCAEIIKPYVRGQDIKRWSPEWAGLWLIFTRRGIDIDAYPAIKEYLLPFREQLEPRPKDWNGGEWLGRKPGPYQWYEIQDSIDYWQLFEQPKIITQDLATYSWFCFDEQGFYPINTCYIWPTADLYILGWLCSPTAWWICHRMLQHSINDTLRMFGEQVKTLPIAPPTNIIRTEVELIVRRLIEITRASHQTQQLMLDWLRSEFEVQEPGARLKDFSIFDVHAFVDEVRKRRPKTARKLTPAALKDLQAGYAEQIAPIQQYRAEATMLERKLSDLINTAYGLTPEEIALLWATAPPRMPLSPH